jgi:hypothetical protein
MYREAADMQQKAVPKGAPWLPLKKPGNLDLGKVEKRRLTMGSGSPARVRRAE